MFQIKHLKYSTFKASMMDKQILLTDGSVNTLSKIGYGAYLCVLDHNLSFEKLKSQAKTRRFEDTSSTKLELQTLLWALGEIQIIEQKITIYTDSQNIIGLLNRRERFEKNNYRSRRNELIKNHELYKEFYKIIDQLDCEFIKVSGHKVSYQKNHVEKLFTIVDRAARNALRKDPFSSTRFR